MPTVSPRNTDLRLARILAETTDRRRAVIAGSLGLFSQGAARVSAADRLIASLNARGFTIKEPAHTEASFQLYCEDQT